jgi:hypothetical protein
MANTKVHELIVKVRFDKPCSRAFAVSEFRDIIHGEFYPTQYNDDNPETMKIAGVKSNPMPRPRRIKAQSFGAPFITGRSDI